jgi:mono/diheme cytochrome c family protein
MLKKSLMHYLLISVLYLAGITTTNHLFAQENAADTGDAQVAQTAEAGDGGGAVSADPAQISEGESLFKANCRACHRVNQKLVGPALAGVLERAPSVDWIMDFVHNSQKVIQGGDEYAVQLYNEYNQIQMPAFPTLSESQITSILAYIESEAAAEGGQEVAEGGGEGSAQQTGDSIPAFYLNAILIGLVIVLVLILVVLVLLSTFIKRFINQKGGLTPEDDEIVNKKRDYRKVLKSPSFIFIVVFIFTAIAFKAVINGLYSIGIQKGYAPEQPIAFSHELHAGDLQIDCQYCHTGVRFSKNANIPSSNMCMNCHKYVLPESPEIQKIWRAVDYRKETDTYGPNREPIEWVRVHTLPDLAYFNHSQHVQVGGVDCENCHGDVAQMEVIRQEKLLTMGWCVDCHRVTSLNTEGNDYYDRLVELHEDEEMEVEDLGGLECARCHY